FYFLLKKTKKYRSNNIIDELNFFRKLLLTIKIFRIENVMDFTFLFIAVVRYGSQFQNTLIDYIWYFNTYILQ
ncbi:hypothetical protein, partial [Acinetobacter baumannii]|uniref:hypothetical protein n=1 Tax=Acinetobacter baumannii TaxID=470 RepID=UPI001C436A2B